MERSKGFTLMELLVTATVLLILAAAVVPVARNSVKRQQELELRRILREMRTAIDRHKDAVDERKIKPGPAHANGYPESLEILVEGVPVLNGTTKMRFLRKIPVDPLTNKAEWGMRSIQDDPTSTSWGGGNVFDVYSLAQGTGMNGIPYKEW